VTKILACLAFVGMSGTLETTWDKCCNASNRASVASVVSLLQNGPEVAKFKAWEADLSGGRYDDKLKAIEISLWTG
jgi:hypothetical protein